MEDIKSKILVTGGGAPGAYGILSSLQAHYQLFSCDMQLETIGAQLADEHFQVPAGDHPDYIDTLLAACQSYGIDLVFPITTRELLPLALSKTRFEEAGIKVLVSRADALKIANDKGALLQHLQQAGVAVPTFKRVVNLEEFKSALAIFSPDEAVIFKPCVANGSRGFRIMDPKADRFKQLFEEKPSSAWINRAEAVELLSEGEFPPLVVSEFLAGEEYTVDCLVDQGEALLIIPRRRDKLNAGISVKGEVVNHPEVIAYCKDVLAQLKLHGPIGIQVKMNAAGQARILEINPRIQGSSVALNGASVNLSLLAVQLGLGQDIRPAIQALDIGWGTRFIRHYQERYWKS